MKHAIIFALMLLFGLTSACEKSDSQLCGGNNPEESLPWLKAEIQTLSSSAYCTSVSRSTYKNETVFIFSNCDPNVNSVPALYDCDGRQLTLSAEDYRYLNFIGEIELIWKSK